MGSLERSLDRIRRLESRVPLLLLVADFFVSTSYSVMCDCLCPSTHGYSREPHGVVRYVVSRNVIVSGLEPMNHFLLLTENPRHKYLTTTGTGTKATPLSQKETPLDISTSHVK